MRKLIDNYAFELFTFILYLGIIVIAESYWQQQFNL